MDHPAQPLHGPASHQYFEAGAEVIPSLPKKAPSRSRIGTGKGLETVEKVACQLIEIDKPLFRERLHERQSSISCEKVGLSFVRGVISDVHAAGNDGLNFIPAAAAAGTPCGKAPVGGAWGEISACI